MYEKKLRRLLQSGGGDEQVNGEEDNAVLYSDSEDEKEGENKFCYFFCLVGDATAWFAVLWPAESDGDKEETVEHSEQSQQDMSQVRVSATEYPLIVINERNCATHIFLYTFSAHT